MALSERNLSTLRYGDESIAYSVRVNPARRERIAIHVHADGAVEVEAPENASEEAIRKAVMKRARWVIQHVTDARKRFEHVLPRQYVSGEQALYLGRRYVLKVVQVPKAERSIKLKRGLLIVATDSIDGSALRARIRAWYRIRARDYFAGRIEAISKALPWVQEPPAFRLLDMLRDRRFGHTQSVPGQGTARGDRLRHHPRALPPQGTQPQPRVLPPPDALHARLGGSQVPSRSQRRDHPK